MYIVSDTAVSDEGSQLLDDMEETLKEGFGFTNVDVNITKSSDVPYVTYEAAADSVATDKLYDVDEVRNLYGVRILGTYFEPMKKRFGYGLDRLITKIYPHAAAEQNRENVLSVAAANIAATVNDGVLHVNTTTVDDDKAAGFDGALLLVGEPETLSPLRMKLPTTLAVNEAEDIVNDATGIQALQNASQVVLVGTLGKTTRKQLEAALLQLEAQKRALCGIVFA